MYPPCPRLAAKDIRVFGTGWIAIVAALRSAFCIAAIIGEKQNQGVLKLIALAQAIHEPADGHINMRHDCRINGHQMVEPILLLGREAFPRRNF